MSPPAAPTKPPQRHFPQSLCPMLLLAAGRSHRRAATDFAQSATTEVTPPPSGPTCEATRCLLPDGRPADRPLAPPPLTPPLTPPRHPWSQAHPPVSSPSQWPQPHPLFVSFRIGLHSSVNVNGFGLHSHSPHMRGERRPSRRGGHGCMIPSVIRRALRQDTQVRRKRFRPRPWQPSSSSDLATLP